MTLSDFKTETVNYEQTFIEFTNGYQLPDAWFRRPDHLAVKCTEWFDYNETTRETFVSLIDDEGLWEIEMGGRFLASGQLASPIMIANFEFGWIEIMQPKPGKEVPKSFVEHTEFKVRDFQAVINGLKGRGVEDHKIQDNGSHAWVNIPIGDDREIKLNNLPLADVVKKEKSQGRLRKIN